MSEEAMDISFLGHSSFRLKGNQASVVTDPYDEYVGFKFPRVAADIVTVSHEHDDHNKVQSVGGVKGSFPGQENMKLRKSPSSAFLPSTMR